VAWSGGGEYSVRDAVRQGEDGIGQVARREAIADMACRLRLREVARRPLRRGGTPALGSFAVRGAERRVGVAKFPVEPRKTVSQKEKPVTCTVGESPQAAESVMEEANKRSNSLRNWTVHVAVYAVAQAALTFGGGGWLVEALLSGLHATDWFRNSSGHWLLNLGRIREGDLIDILSNMTPCLIRG